MKKTFGPETKLGKRRTTLASPPDVGGIDFTAALVEREPITVIVSTKGWIRALKGHVADLSGVAFKGDDRTTGAKGTATFRAKAGKATVTKTGYTKATRKVKT